MDVAKLFSDADAAVEAEAYDKAAQAQKNLIAHQGQEAQSRMMSFQRGLAEAVARGDASAKAAADLIRQAHTVH